MTDWFSIFVVFEVNGQLSFDHGISLPADHSRLESEAHDQAMARRLGRLGAKMMKTLRKTGAIEGSVVSLLGALAALAMVAASQEQRAPPDLEAKTNSTDHWRIGRISRLLAILCMINNISEACKCWHSSDLWLSHLVGLGLLMLELD